MGRMIDGKWTRDALIPKNEDGRFRRPDSAFRSWITADGSAGPSGEGGFPAAAGRYHLYVSLACPWAHRTLIFRRLKGLAGMISLSVVDPLMGEDGWTFSEGPGCIPDTVNGARFLYEIYAKADRGYNGKASVPVLWDRERQTIVNNESSEIIRMFNSAFDGLGAAKGDFYPSGLRGEIDAVNARVYASVNNGVYRCGFAMSQAAYDEAFAALFETLESLERRLRRQSYLAGARVTEADWRLFTTLVRFDPVYHGHFKCNRRKLSEYPALWNYARALYQVPGVAETVNLDHIKRHYYTSHPQINPSRIVPQGPEIDFAAPHDRQTVVLQ